MPRQYVRVHLGITWIVKWCWQIAIAKQFWRPPSNESSKLFLCWSQYSKFHTIGMTQESGCAVVLIVTQCQIWNANKFHMLNTCTVYFSIFIQVSNWLKPVGTNTVWESILSYSHYLVQCHNDLRHKGFLGGTIHDFDVRQKISFRRDFSNVL